MVLKVLVVPPDPWVLLVQRLQGVLVARRVLEFLSDQDFLLVLSLPSLPVVLVFRQDQEVPQDPGYPGDLQDLSHHGCQAVLRYLEFRQDLGYPLVLLGLGHHSVLYHLGSLELLQLPWHRPDHWVLGCPEDPEILLVHLDP